MVVFESLIECDVIRLLEFSPGVVSYREQPIELRYPDDGDVWRTAYPDFEATLSSGEIFHIEVKHSTKVATKKVGAKLRQIAEHYRRHRSERFLVITEKEARRNPLFTNLKVLSPLRARAWNIQPLPTLLLETYQSWEVVLGRKALLKHISIGNLVCDLTAPLESDLPVTVNQGEENVSCLF